ncbi:MAG: NAD(P)-dependent oxidoreductase [Planctomycetota bacterium]|nr:NAD(P)-dependent oxidoreductase [Planctomycetota bacterium]
MSYVAWLPSEDDPEDPFLRHLRGALDERVSLLVAPEVPDGVHVDGLVRGVPGDEHLAACPELKHLFIPYAGLPKATRERLGERPEVAVHNLHHNAAPTAELAVALLLAAAKRVLPYDRDLRQGDWRRRWGPPEAATLAGGHAVILGYGAIGQRVAAACRALGMRVTAIRRQAGRGDRHGPVALAPPSELTSVVGDALALVVCLPLTEATEGIVDAQVLAALPETAYVVNIGRGPLIQEQPFYEALRDGRLAGAGLDVWYTYPRQSEEREQTLPSAFPFHELDNVVLSPHRAGLTLQNEPMRAKALARLLVAAAAGEDVPNPVDLEHGY